MKLDKSKDKDYLIELCKHLKVSKNNIRLDGCDDVNIYGARGHIFTDSLSWYFYPTGVNWAYAKKKLPFMVVSQDGDSEGILRMDRMPTEEEADIVRKMLKLMKVKVLSETEREVLKIRLKSYRERGGKGVADAFK